MAARKFQASAPVAGTKVDLRSAIQSAVGMTLVVYGMLQSKMWGWIIPTDTKPTISGHELAPFGISMSSWLILTGVVVLVMFYNRQQKLESTKSHPLLQVSMLSLRQLRSGLSVLLSQYMITAAVFFVVPIYLQMVLGLDALQTGIKIFPLSVALILASVVGSKMANTHSPKKIVNYGQYLLVIGSVFLLGSLDINLTSWYFATAMFMVGAGLGLLASQLGNVNMSSVPEKQSNEVGGLQGTFQNIGSSLGTALIGSVMVMSLTTGFINSVNASTLPQKTKEYIDQNVTTAQIVPADEVEQFAISQGASQETAEEVAGIYQEAQLSSLRKSVFFLVILSFLVIALSRGIPDKIPK